MENCKHEFKNRGEECIKCGANPWVMCAKCGKDFESYVEAKVHGNLTGHDIRG